MYVIYAEKTVSTTMSAPKTTATVVSVDVNKKDPTTGHPFKTDEDALNHETNALIVKGYAIHTILWKTDE